jgi:HD-GYP domain-containing protein (c-di-GMP phosphodiesterase class II)
MLKKINVADLRLEMFIHEICGSWMDHPFWKKKFLLDSEKNLKILQECGIQEVWIDTDRGLDVEQQDQEEDAAEGESGGEGAPREQRGRRRKLAPRVDLDEETARAQKVHATAKRTVFALYQDARDGKEVDVTNAAMLVDEIAGSVARNPGALLSMARIRNLGNYLYVHAVAVCTLMTALGRQMGIEGEALRNLGVAGLMLDIGMMAVPDEVLNKRGSLSEEEFNLVKEHPRRGWEMLSKSPGIDGTVLDVCLHHQEWVDGTGYPDKLSGSAISQAARIAAVCDVYDAITSDRYNRKGMIPAAAIRKMAELRNTRIDEAVFHAFVKTVGIYPVGSLLRLKSGRLAVVLEQGEKSLLTPIVKVFFSVKSNEQIYPELLDLSRSQDTIVSAENPADWKLDLQRVTGP